MVEPGPLSPDGRWRWDGAQWVPAQPQRAPRSRRRRWVWVLAGCLTVVVLTTAGAGYGIYSLVQGIRNGSITCLPNDFPRYPGATYAEFSFDLNGPATACHAVFVSNDDVATVAAFYQSKLNTGAWQVTSLGDPADVVIFQPARSDVPFGTVHVAVMNAHTEITIDLYNSTCLLLNFPKYPGTRFGGESADVSEGRNACHVLFISSDSVAAVTSFYERELNTGNWQVISSAAGQIDFRLRSGKRTVGSGTVTIAVSHERTEIKVDSYF